MLETFNMGGEDGVVHETPQEQRERGTRIVNPQGCDNRFRA